MAAPSSSVLAVCFFAVALAPLKARADDSFAMMDRATPATAGSVFGLDTSYSRFEDPLLDGLSSVRLDGHVTVFREGRRAALFGVLPLAFALQRGESELALGNLEVGYFRVHALGSPTTVTWRLGVALPTASSRAAGAVTNGAAALSRIGDLVLGMPSTLTGRASVSLVSTSQAVVARADLGIDVPILEQSSLIAELSHTPVARANLALGLGGPFGNQVSLESINVIGAEDVLATFGTPEDSATLHQLGLTLRHPAGRSSHLFGLFTNPRTLVGSDDGFVVTLAYQLSRRGAR